MTLRTSRRTVAFTRAFSLRGVDGVQPAGTYTVETDEELLESLSFPVYRRVATTIDRRSAFDWRTRRCRRARVR